MFTRVLRTARKKLLRAARMAFSVRAMTTQQEISDAMRALAKRRWSKVSKHKRKAHGKKLASIRHKGGAK